MSELVTAKINFVDGIEIGTMTNLAFQDESFDFVYSCEALEHSINMESALEEIYRITKKSGLIVIIDKPIEKLGVMEIDAWEQWISGEQIKRFADSHIANLKIIPSVMYEDGKNDGLFRAWIIRKP